MRLIEKKVVIELSSDSEESATARTSRPRAGPRRRRGRPRILCSDGGTEGEAEVTDGWLTKRRTLTQQKEGRDGRSTTRRRGEVSRRRRRRPLTSSVQIAERCSLSESSEFGGESSGEYSLDIEESEEWSSQSDTDGSSCILIDSDSTNYWTLSDDGESQEIGNSQDMNSTRTSSVASTDVALFGKKPSGNIPPLLPSIVTFFWHFSKSGGDV